MPTRLFSALRLLPQFFFFLPAFFCRITFKPSKPLSFIVDYVLRRRYGAHISAEDQRSADVSFSFEGHQWSRSDRNTEMRHVFAVLRHPYRLTYCFDESILSSSSFAASTTAHASVFEAKTRNATTLFDASNSFFNGGGLAGEISLGFGFFGENSLLGGAPGLAAPPALPATASGTSIAHATATAGPLASHFESENSFSAFLSSPLGVAAPGSEATAREGTGEAKRMLFE